MKINECVKCASFGDHRSRDHELTHKRTKKCDFWLESLLIRLMQLKNHLACKAEICKLSVAYKWFMQTEFESAQSRDQHVTGRTWGPIYLGKYRF